MKPTIIKIYGEQRAEFAAEQSGKPYQPCNGIVFTDDGHAVQLTVRKLYHAVPAVVAIRSVEGEAP